jgi:hypothetical protein
VNFAHTELEYPSIHAIDCEKAGQLKKLRRPRWLALSTVAVAITLISVPAGALAIGEESGTSATTGEGATESTESSPPAEGSNPSTSTGWVPQGDAAEDTGDAAATTRRGSSLGSGGSSNQSRSPDAQPASGKQPAPTPASSGSYEPEASSPSTFEEPASTPRAVPTGDSEPQAVEPATTAVGAANPVATTASPQDSTRPVPPVEATPVANLSEQAAAGSGGLPWPLLVVCVLVLLYAGARLLLGPVELDIFRSSPFRRVRRTFPRA